MALKIRASDGDLERQERAWQRFVRKLSKRPKRKRPKSRDGK